MIQKGHATKNYAVGVLKFFDHRKNHFGLVENCSTRSLKVEGSVYVNERDVRTSLPLADKSIVVFDLVQNPKGAAARELIRLSEATTFALVDLFPVLPNDARAIALQKILVRPPQESELAIAESAQHLDKVLRDCTDLGAFGLLQLKLTLDRSRTVYYEHLLVGAIISALERSVNDQLESKLDNHPWGEPGIGHRRPAQLLQAYLSATSRFPLIAPKIIGLFCATPTLLTAVDLMECVSELDRLDQGGSTAPLTERLSEVADLDPKKFFQWAKSLRGIQHLDILVEKVLTKNLPRIDVELAWQLVNSEDSSALRELVLHTRLDDLIKHKWLQVMNWAVTHDRHEIVLRGVQLWDSASLKASDRIKHIGRDVPFRTALFSLQSSDEQVVNRISWLRLLVEETEPGTAGPILLSAEDQILTLKRLSQYVAAGRIDAADLQRIRAKFLWSALGALVLSDVIDASYDSVDDVLTRFRSILNNQFTALLDPGIGEAEYRQRFYLHSIAPRCTGRVRGENTEPPMSIACEGRFWKTVWVKESYGGPQVERSWYHCRGGRCEKPNDTCDTGAPASAWSIYEIAQTFGKKLRRAQISVLAGWLNRMNEVFDRLVCRSCESLLRPVVVKPFRLGHYALPNFHCINSGCVDHHVVVRITHCRKCGQTLDSRDCTRCSNKWMICSNEDCRACCPQHADETPIAPIIPEEEP